MKHKQVGINFENLVKNTINSGTLSISPLDLESKDNFIECKYTEQQGYRIAKKLLDKVWGQSLSLNKEPVLVIGIKRDDNTDYVLTCQLSIAKTKRNNK